MIFAKNNPPPLTHNRYDPAFEFMFVFGKGKPKTFNPLLDECSGVGKKLNRNSGNKARKEEGYITRVREEITITKKYKYRKNIWYYSVGSGDSGNHPAPFPEDLAKDHILSWTNENDIVYDCFSGSGTTCKIAKLLNRKYIGSELSQQYHKESLERINNIDNNNKT